MGPMQVGVLWAAVGWSCLSLATTAQGAEIFEAQELDASQCELYIESFGFGSVRYLNQEQKFLEVQLKVNDKDLVERQGDQILGAGMAVTARSFTAFDDADGKALLDVLEYSEMQHATRTAPSSYQVRFTFEERKDGQTFFKEVHGISFFLVVKRASGRTQRLWVKNGGSPYTIDRIFDRGGTEEALSIGAVRYPAPDSALYDQKRACAPLATTAVR